MAHFHRSLGDTGVAGGVCGRLYVQARKHPEVFLHIVKCTAISGVCGSLFGLAVLAYRNDPSHGYVLTMGATCSLATASFLSVRQSLLWLSSEDKFESIPSAGQRRSVLFNDGLRSVLPVLNDPFWRKYICSSASGGLTLAMLTLSFKRQVTPVLEMTVLGTVSGAVGQASYNHFSDWRRHRAAIMHYPELFPDEIKKRDTWSTKSMGERFVNFWHQTSRACTVEAKLSLLKEKVQKETLLIEQLNEQLVLLGEVVEEESEVVVGRASSVDSNSTRTKPSQAVVPEINKLGR